MKVERAPGSYQTYIILDANEIVTDNRKRYYALPREFRDDKAAEAAQPSMWPTLDPNLEHPDIDAYRQSLQLMDAIYWKIVADTAERNMQEEQARHAV